MLCVKLKLLHRAIDVVERKFGITGGTVILKCKDFRVIQLDIPGLEQCTNIADSIEMLSSLGEYFELL